MIKVFKRKRAIADNGPGIMSVRFKDDTMLIVFDQPTEAVEVQGEQAIDLAASIIRHFLDEVEADEA